MNDLENSPDRKKILFVSCNGHDMNVCNYNMYFYIGGYTQMYTDC